MWNISNQDRANVLVQALPYIQKMSGKTIVVKYGGNAMISPELKDAVMSDISTSVNEMTNMGVAVDGEYLWAKLNDAIDNASTLIKADKKDEIEKSLEEPEIEDIER